MKKYTFRSFVENRMQFGNNNPMSLIANNIRDLIDWTKRQGDKYHQAGLERFQMHFILPLGRNMDPKLAAEGAATLRQLAAAADSAANSANQKDLNLINSLNSIAKDMEKLARAKPLS
jgi:hypothetical protein